MSRDTKYHFYMIAGMIMFTNKGAGEDAMMGSAASNAIVRHDSKTFGVAQLGKAQQNLHKGFIVKIPEEARAGITVHDIVLTNISYLGFMSEKEFQKPPAGMELRDGLPVLSASAPEAKELEV